MLNRIIEVALKAGEIIINAHCENSDVSVKPGDANFVTVYDLKVQKFIKDSFKEIIPSAHFIGEEEEAVYTTDAEYTVIADPIDGTTNFIKGFNHSCVSIALLKKGMPIIGCVYNPYTKEMFYAKKGEGAFLNGKKISVSKNGLENALVGFGTSPYYAEFYNKTFETIDKIFPIIADIRRVGSAALDICYVASGRTELYFEYLLSPWDYAAASLILTEAGGVITTDNYSEISYNRPNSIIAATNKALDDFKKVMEK